MLCCQVSELFLAGLVMQTDLVPLDELPHKEVAECYVLGTRAEHSVPYHGQSSGAVAVDRYRSERS